MDANKNGNGKKVAKEMTGTCECDGCNCSHGCGPWGSYGSWGGHHWFFRLIIKLLVIVFIFGLGVKIGELKMFIEEQIYAPQQVCAGMYCPRAWPPYLMMGGQGGMMQPQAGVQSQS